MSTKTDTEKTTEEVVQPVKKTGFHRWSAPGVAGKIEYVHNFKIKYDSIVDRSEFRPDSETTRAARLAKDTGSYQGSYDYPDGKITEERKPSDLVIGLRTNKFDKAEVQEIAKSMNEKAQAEDKSAKDAKKLAKVQRETEARQAYLDKATGFDSSAVSEE